MQRQFAFYEDWKGQVLFDQSLILQPHAPVTVLFIRLADELGLELKYAPH